MIARWLMGTDADILQNDVGCVVSRFRACVSVTTLATAGANDIGEPGCIGAAAAGGGELRCLCGWAERCGRGR